jgi:hypothetical protein
LFKVNGMGMDIKSANFTAQSGHKYQVDTSNGEIAVILPLVPTPGDSIEFFDAGLSWDTNSLTLGRNGTKINSVASDYVASGEGARLTATYISPAIGWSILDPSGASGGGSEPLKYVALLTQSGTNAPVATVLENTLGGVPLWDYSEAGSWFGTLAGAFTASKSGVKGLVGNDVGQLLAASFDGTDTISLYGSYNGTPSNGLLNKTLIEIIVYP